MSGRALALAALLCLGWTGPALGHVEVLPERVPAGEPTSFTIRVPQEEGVVTGVTVTFPERIAVFGIRPPGAGFAARPVEAPDGTLRGVRYVGGRIAARQYEDFEVRGTPREPGVAVWRVEERLADGSTRLWTGPPGGGSAEPAAGEPGPAPSTEIVQATAGGEAAAQTGNGRAADGGEAAAQAPDDDDDAALWLALIAAVVAVGAAVVAGLVWASRPMTLPEDERS
jgi:hypothetical protein